MFKTILVHVDASAGAASRIDTAARLALSNHAHLIGSAMTGLSSFMFPISAMDAGMPPIAFPVEELRTAADQVLDLFESRVRQFELDHVERRRLDEEVGVGLCLQARYADLVVIGQQAASEALPIRGRDFTSYVILNSPRPVLVLPTAGPSGAIGKRVTVAWNGSTQAVRAITSAIPVLRHAERVDLVVVLKNGWLGEHGEEPGADIALYLARHGIKVVVRVIDNAGDEGDALLSCAAESGSDLIVMGAFGHTRLREFALGGATRTALRSSTVPLWMAH